jgi:hypothetical protein
MWSAPGRNRLMTLAAQWEAKREQQEGPGIRSRRGESINATLVAWAMREYKRYAGQKIRLAE